MHTTFRNLVVRLSMLALLLGTLSLTEGAAQAQDEILTKMTAARIERIATSFSDVENFKEVDNNTYTFEVDKIKIVLINSGTTMQLAAVFTGKISLSRINEWNRDKKFTRAYLDEDEDVVLDHAIELNGGVTEQNVKEWMKTYVALLEDFAQHLND